MGSGVKVSHFDHAKDTDPKQADITWEFFTAELGPHDFTHQVKKFVPCFSPAEYDLDEPGVERDDDFVKRLSLFVLDVDEVTEATFHALVAYVQQLGLAAVVYSTWSHAEALATKGLWKFRVVIPLDVPVEAPRWREFWAKANYGVFGGVGDAKCVNESRLYFGPFAPAGTEAVNFYFVMPGNPLTTASVFALPMPAQSVSGTQGALEEQKFKTSSQQAIDLLAAAWPAQRRHEAHLALAGGLLGSGYPDDAALEFLCAVARQHAGSEEERDKRESAVQHTREQIAAGQNITGWTTLGSIVGYDVVEKVRACVEKPPDVTADQLKRYAKQLKRSKIDQKSEIGDALERVCEGRVFPEPLALRVAAELGTRFVDYDPKSLAEMFTTSIAAMRKDGEGVSVEQVEARIKLKQDEARQKREETRKLIAEREQQVEEDKASRIRQSFNNGRSHPYTADELRACAQQVANGQQWVIQKDRAFYFFHHVGFRGPYTEAEAHNAALRELAPAVTAGVNLFKINKDGSADFKSLKQIVAEYGSVADELVIDMRAQTTRYEPYTRTIVEASCPLRPIAPVYHPEIDEWLWWLAGDEFWLDLKTWLAILPRLDIIRVALFLTGKASVGKSMLALGCSRLWTTRGPTSLEAAFGSFNDLVAHCPLCFADEQLPKNFRGYTMNPELRQHIQATERTYKRKYLPNGKLIGVTPTIVAAHDRSILRTPEHLSNNEILAIMDRYFHIATRPEAADYLARLRPTTFERGWVEGDKIAEFVMWLYYNHQHQSQGRFYINRPDVENTRWLATSSGARSSVLRWLCSYLADRRKFETDANTLMLVRVYQGQLLVNIRGLLEYWDKYIGNEKCPPAGDLATTISELSHAKRVQLRNGKGVPTNYRSIELGNIYAWAKNSDLITEDEIQKQLAVDSVETSLGLVRRI